MANNINARVIQLQREAGWDVGQAWYDKYVTQTVGNDGDEEAMYGAFVKAFNEHFTADSGGDRQADSEALDLGAKPIDLSA